MTEFKLWRGDGECVGRVMFDPYSYEYTGSVTGVETVLESGPPERVMIGATTEVDMKGGDDSVVQTDTMREATLEERVDELQVQLESYGVVCEDISETGGEV